MVNCQYLVIIIIIIIIKYIYIAQGRTYNAANALSRQLHTEKQHLQFVSEHVQRNVWCMADLVFFYLLVPSVTLV